MEVSALKYPAGVGRYGRSHLLRIQSDEHLIRMIRAGHDGAFEVIVSRYQTRLLSFCRHLLSSREDAEDVLQEAFSAAYHAILADDRPINVRPWLYRIARNRCLNHLRRVPAVPTDAMDVMYAENGETTADKVHRREEFRLLVGDIHELAETQRTALLLREMDALSYEQIAEAMETSVSSVKSLLVRARVSLAEASEARLLSCEDIRGELGEVAEGLIKRPNALVRRHLKTCERCLAFNKQLKRTNRALGVLLPVGPLAVLKGGVLSHVVTGHAGHGAATMTGSAATAGAGTSVAGSGAAASVAGASASTGMIGAAASSSSGFVSAGIGALATKAAAGLAVAAVFTAGVAESHHPSATAHRFQFIATRAAAAHARAGGLHSSVAASAARTAAANRLSENQTAHHAGASAAAAAPVTAHTAATRTSAAGHSATATAHTATTNAAISTAAAAAAASGANTAAGGSGAAATAATTGGLSGPSSSSPSRRHGTAISSPGSSSSAGSKSLLTLGRLTTPSSTPTVPGTGGASTSAPSSSFPSGGSTDSGSGGPVVSAVNQVVTTVAGALTSPPSS